MDKCKQMHLQFFPLSYKRNIHDSMVSMSFKGQCQEIECGCTVVISMATKRWDSHKECVVVKHWNHIAYSGHAFSLLLWKRFPGDFSVDSLSLT